MKNKKLTIKIKATGELVEVYKHRDGGYVNWKDLTTKYESDKVELQ